MFVLIRSYHDILNFLSIPLQNVSQDCPKILGRLCQDLTKISMGGQPESIEIHDGIAGLEA